MLGAILTRVQFPDATRNNSPRVKFHTIFFFFFFFLRRSCRHVWAGTTEWLQRGTRSWWEGLGFEERRENFLLQGQLSVLLLSYPFHLRVTAVARKRPRSFCQKCRWQVTAQHTCILRVWIGIKWHCKVVHGCILYTKLAPRRQQFHVTTAV